MSQDPEIVFEPFLTTPPLLPSGLSTFFVLGESSEFLDTINISPVSPETLSHQQLHTALVEGYFF